MAYARIALITQCGGSGCSAVYAAVYRAYAIRPYNFRKTIIAHSFQNFPKTAWDVRKTMSYVEKIMSDIGKTTSDIILAFSTVWKTIPYSDSLK